MKKRILSFLRMPFLTKDYWLRLEQKKIEKRYRETLRSTKGNRGEIDHAKTEHHSDWWSNYEQQEALFTEKLIKKAERLRVHVPAKPSWNYETGFEENEDWDGINERYLTNTGIAKVRDEIRKEQKWQREGRANWAVFASAIGGVIGAITGLVAVMMR